jgi:hypothetical protein
MVVFLEKKGWAGLLTPVDEKLTTAEIRVKELPAPEVPSTGSPFDPVAGCRFVADAEQSSTVTAHWRYQGVKHAERS